MAGTTALDDAERAVRLADDDPRASLPFVERAARRASRERDAVATSTAERAWGHALMLCGSMDDAVRHLRRAVRWGERAESSTLAAEARMKLAYALSLSGRSREGLLAIDSALAVLKGAAGGRARAQRGSILRNRGRSADALAEYNIAVPALRRAGDTLGVERALINRGLIRIDLYAFGAAEADLVEAEELSRRLGLVVPQGMVAHNLSLLERLRGNVPAALSHLDRAEQILAAHAAEGNLGAVHSDRAEVLLSVGLAREAALAADRAIALSEQVHRRLFVPEALVVRARAAALGGEWASAIDYAGRARRAFLAQQRPLHAALARLELLRAQVESGRPSRHARVDLDDALATVAGAGGLLSEELDARLLAARLALRGGDATTARHHLDAVATRARRGSASVRARGWYARALSSVARDDAAAATRQVRAGLRVLDEHAAALGATDLRVHSAAHRADLADLGLRLALRDARPTRVFEWAERTRASRLLQRPVRPPADPTLARLLAELRRLAVDGDPAAPARQRRQVELEQQIRDHVRRHAGPIGERIGGPVGRRALSDALGDAALIEFVVVDGDLYGLSLVADRLRLRSLGDAAAVARLVECVPFALHRLSRRDRPAPTESAARVLLADATAQLDALLLEPFGSEIDDRPLVVVPTSTLHSLPWSSLPSCRGRAVTVAPSATVWHTTATRPVAANDTVVVASGPGLTGAADEAAAVAAIHGVSPLTGAVVTVDSVLHAMGTAGLLHLAAHGRLSADNPLFSALLLADGPLVVYDLEGVSSVPPTVVLAACDSGRTLVYAGDELLGLTSTLISAGATQLIASVLPIPDAETAPLMVALHRRLATGEAPAMALAAAQAEVDSGDAPALAAAAGFVCLGAGFRSIGSDR